MNDKDKQAIAKAKRLLEYRPDGTLYWRVRRGGVKKGRRAGSKDKNGYRRVKIDGKRFGEHRVIWAMHHGWWPKQIDHINGIRDDNRIDNLRAATPQQNQANKRAFNSHGMPKGVQYEPRNRTHKYVARIKHKKKSIHIGSYRTPEEARAAYLSYAKKVFGEYAS